MLSNTISINIESIPGSGGRYRDSQVRVQKISGPPAKNVRTTHPTCMPGGSKFVRTQPTFCKFWAKICSDSQSDLPPNFQGSCSRDLANKQGNAINRLDHPAALFFVSPPDLPCTPTPFLTSRLSRRVHLLTAVSRPLNHTWLSNPTTCAPGESHPEIPQHPSRVPHLFPIFNTVHTTLDTG